MRQPRPWFRRQTRTSYVQFGKKQINSGKNKRQAWKQYHQLMADNPGTEYAVNPTMHTTLHLYLDWRERNLARAAAKTNRFHNRRFSTCTDESLRISDVKPHHVQTWIDKQYRGKSDTYKHTAISVIQGALRWAAEQGRIEHSPL